MYNLDFECTAAHVSADICIEESWGHLRKILVVDRFQGERICGSVRLAQIELLSNLPPCQFFRADSIISTTLGYNVE